MTPNEKPEMSLKEKVEATGNIVLFVASCWVAPIVAFTRTGFGSRYFGTHAAIGLFVFWLVAESDAPGLGILLAALVWGRMAQHKLRARRTPTQDAPHSYYSGMPWIAGLFKLTEEQAKRLWEPLLVLGTGLFVGEMAPLLGKYLMGGAGALAILFTIGQEYRRRMVERMRDAQLEQQRLNDDCENF
jgi:hypothetical protein